MAPEPTPVASAPQPLPLQQAAPPAEAPPLGAAPAVPQDGRGSGEGQTARRRRDVRRRRAPRAARVAVALEAVVAASAFGGGGAMLRDPAGALGLPPSMLERLPVDSWRLPGLALIACNGALPLVTAAADLAGRGWPRRYGHVAVGAMVLAWPTAETALFGYPVGGEPRWLRPAVAGTGLALMALGLHLRRQTPNPWVARHDTTEPAAAAEPPAAAAEPPAAAITGSS